MVKTAPPVMRTRQHEQARGSTLVVLRASTGSQRILPPQVAGGPGEYICQYKTPATADDESLSGQVQNAQNTLRHLHKEEARKAQLAVAEVGPVPSAGSKKSKKCTLAPAGQKHEEHVLYKGVGMISHAEGERIQWKIQEESLESSTRTPMASISVIQ